MEKLHSHFLAYSKATFLTSCQATLWQEFCGSSLSVLNRFEEMQNLSEELYVQISTIHSIPADC